MERGAGHAGGGGAVLNAMVPTLGGYPYDMECCGMDPYRVAIALGDQTIRVWSTDSAKHPFQCSLLWKGLQAKVVCVRWHPLLEGKVAFAVDDGRVGLYDCLSEKYRILPGRHAGTIYQLAWWVGSLAGPGAVEEPAASGQEAMGCVLFSCGKDGVILGREAVWGWGGTEGQGEGGAVRLVPLLLRAAARQAGTGAGAGAVAKVSEFGVSPDGRSLAVGRVDGEVDLFDVSAGLGALFRLLHADVNAPEGGGSDGEARECVAWRGVLKGHTSLINRICWHPCAEKEEWGWRRCATACEGGDICVWSFGEAGADAGEGAGHTRKTLNAKA